MRQGDAQGGTRGNDYSNSLDSHKKQWASTVQMETKVLVFAAGMRQPKMTPIEAINRWEEITDGDMRKPPDAAKKTIGRWLKGKGIPVNEKAGVPYGVVRDRCDLPEPILGRMLDQREPTVVIGLNDQDRWQKLSDRMAKDRDWVQSLGLQVLGDIEKRYVCMIAGAREVEGFSAKLVELLDRWHPVRDSYWVLFDHHLKEMVGLFKPNIEPPQARQG